MISLDTRLAESAWCNHAAPVVDVLIGLRGHVVSCSRTTNIVGMFGIFLKSVV